MFILQPEHRFLTQLPWFLHFSIQESYSQNLTPNSQFTKFIHNFCQTESELYKLKSLQVSLTLTLIQMNKALQI